MLCEILVGKAEMMVAEETAVGRQRGRMRRTQDEVARGVYQLRLALRVAAPEYEHDVVSVGRQLAYYGVGKLLPTPLLVAAGHMRAHRQRGIEQQHALLCPAHEVSAAWHGHAEVALYLLEYVDKRRRKRHAIVHREAQPVGLPRLMVRVLAYYHNLNLAERAKVEGVEDEPSWGITRGAFVFVAHKFDKVGEIRFLELLAYMLLPALFYLYVHGRC